MTDAEHNRAGRVVRRLRDLGFELPEAPEPKGHYAGARVEGAMVHVSGHTDRGRAGRNGAGPLQDSEAEIVVAQSAAEYAAVNLLASAAAACSLDELSGVVTLRGYVVAESDFTSHPRVIDAASRLLHRVLGGPPHARAAIGVASLPGAAVVELEATLQRCGGHGRHGTET